MVPIIILAIIAGIILYLRLAPKVRLSKKVIYMIVGGVILLILLVGSIRIVPPGYVGVQVLLGGVSKNILKNGIHLVVPIIELKQMNVRTQEYTMTSIKEEGLKKGDDAISALTKDGLQIKLDLTVWYSLDPKEAAVVYQTIGPNYIDKIVRPAIRTAIRDAAVEYNVTEIYSSKRAELTDKIFSTLYKSLKEKGIIVDKVLLRNLVLPDKVKNAIDEKIAAEQDAQKMEYVLQKEEREKERRLIEAEGIANAQKKISESLNKQYLQWYYIQNLKEVIKTDNSKLVIMPYDQNLTPLLDTR